MSEEKLMRTATTLSVALSLLLAGSSQACSCERLPDGGIRFPTAAQVFVGRVVSTEKVSVAAGAVASQTLWTQRLSPSVLDSYTRVCFAIELVEIGLPMSSVCVGTGSLEAVVADSRS